MFSRNIAGCCRRVLVVVLVSVLLVSACSPASEEEGSGGSPGAASGASSPSGVWGDVFTGEELEGLREVFTDEELESMERRFSGEELEEWFGSGSAVWGSAFEVARAGEEGSRAEPRSRFEAFAGEWAALQDWSDDELRALAFVRRVSLGDDPWGIDANDVSTPIGAFCWAVLRLREVMPAEIIVLFWGASALALDWYVDNLSLWIIEREAAGRGLELEWDTGLTDYNGSLRRFLLQATAPGVRDVVFAEGLPPLLKPLAERFYDYFDRLLELGVYRARPTLAEVSAHRDLAGMTGEDVRRVWPEVLEIELSREDHEEYVELFALLENDEVQRLLNGECEQRTNQEIFERICPPWAAESVPEVCAISDGDPRYSYLPSGSDCLFGCPEAPEEGDPMNELFMNMVSSSGFESVSAGLNIMCGAGADEIVWCWNWWELPNGEQGDLYTPGSASKARSVAAGWSLVCNVSDPAGELECGSLGSPLADVETPAGEFKEVSAGIEHACAIRVTGRLACWSLDRASAKASPPAGEFVSVDAGWDGDAHLPQGDNSDDGGLSCGLRTDAAVECWGEQSLTFGEGSERGDEFAGVDVGHSGQVCVLRTDGIIHCGEDRVYGSDYPSGSRFAQVSVGGLNHICGLRANGSVECWNPNGEFLGSIPGPFTETTVGHTYTSIPFACGLLADGRIVCWDLIEEVFNWAANGLEEYTHPQCFPHLTEGRVCWTAGVDPPLDTNDIYLKESPILLPHSNSFLYPNSDSN